MTALSTRVQGSSTPANVPVVPIEPELARALKRLAGRANEAVTKRDQAILDAHRAGASLREIEAATGIHFVTVKRLIDRLKDAPVTADEHRARALEEVAQEFAKRSADQEEQP